MRCLICEVCGGKDFVKENGMFICQSCGIKYTTKEAEKIMIDVSSEKSRNTISLKNKIEKNNVDIPLNGESEENEIISSIKKQKNEKDKKKKKFLISTIGLFVFSLIVFFIFFFLWIAPNFKYKSATKLMNDCEYAEAYEYFSDLNGFRDSQEKALECIDLYKKAKINNIGIGDIVEFGLYEQDNNLNNGEEPIKWRVLEIEDNKALLISEYAIDCKAFNDAYTSSTWENSTLRQWLNGTFFENAFNKMQRSIVETSAVLAEKNPNFNTHRGNDTFDSVFLIGVKDAEKYFALEDDRTCIPTEYAKANGVYTDDGYSNCKAEPCGWWLRTCGSSQNCTSNININGAINFGGTYNYIDNLGVRPAIWICFDE